MDALCSTVQEEGVSAGLDEHPPVRTLLPNELMNDDVQVWHVLTYRYLTIYRTMTILAERCIIAVQVVDR
jgi:hypothetical protein